MSLPETRTAGSTPVSTDDAAPAVPMSRVLGAMILPLFFMTAFVLAYLSALHAPVPHDLALTVAGPSQSMSRVVAGIEDRSTSAFDITRTTSADAAVRAVEDRSAVGAIVIGAGTSPTVTTVVATGGGALPAQTVESVGTAVAQQLGTTATVRNVRPLFSGDSSGSGLFFLIVLCTVGAYLSMTVVGQALPGAGRRRRIAIAAAVAVLTPVVAFAAMAFSVGAYDASFGAVAATLGVAAIYTFVVELIALLLADLLGPSAIFGIVLLILAGNFPSAGGSVPESMLPPFWQAIHAVWFGSGALESIRSLIYFGGAGFGWPFVRLLMWLVAVAAVSIGVARAKGPLPQPGQSNATVEAAEAGTAGVATAAAVASA